MTVPQAVYPTGTVTFLFTDIGGSTRLWEQAPDAMRVALASHDAIMRAAVEEQGGVVFKTIGDAVCAAFGNPASAVVAGVAAQRRLAAHAWPPAIGKVEVRMAIHTGAAAETGGDYFGPPLNRVARLIALASPGQMLVSQSTATLLSGALPAGIELRNLGVFRLKDLTEPEPTAQVVAEGLQSDFPPLRSLDARPNNLPFEIARFVGRERELAEIREQLGTRRLITIVGPGAIGKTRLALQAAADAADRYNDGTWFVDLTSADGPTFVAQAIAVVLNVREEPQRPIEETLADAIGPKTMIVVLDGIERFVEPAAALAKKLLSRCPSLQILATGREPLHVTGERIMRIGALAEAAELFIDRALENGADAALGQDPDEAAAIVDLCRRLDGIPLAIELAAAYAATHSPRELLSRLSKSMKLLVSRDTTREKRHRTLRAAIAWSYDLFAEPEAEALRALAIFEGSFDVSAAAAVLDADEDDALGLLDEFAVKSMLSMVGGSRPARYAMMSTVREYLREVTTDDAFAGRIALRHFRYFEHVVAAGADTNANDLPPWFERIDADLVNVRAALAWGLTEQPERFAKMTVTLTPYWKARGAFTEGRSYLERAVDLPLTDDALRARLLRRAATFAIEQDDYAAARSSIVAAQQIFERLGDINGVAEALFTQALIEQRIGHEDVASDTYRKAIAAFRDASNALGEATALHNFTLFALAREDFDEAEARLDEAERPLAMAGDDGLVAHFVALRARVALKRNNLTESHALYLKSLAMLNRVENRLSAAVIQAELSIVFLRMQRSGEAVEAARECLRTGLEIGSSALLIYGFDALCEIALEAGRFDEAARCFGLASALRTSHYSFEDMRDIAAVEQALRAKLGERVDKVMLEARSADFAAAAREFTS